MCKHESARQHYEAAVGLAQYPARAWHDLHQQFEPLARHCGRENVEPGGIAARVRKACDEPATYWIADLNKYNGNSARLAEHRRCHRRAVGQDHVGSGVHAHSCELGYCLRIRPRPTMLEPDVTAFRP